MAKNQFKYILRCAIAPGFHEEARVANLIKFCKAAKIDDVAFIINSEEINQGHITEKETMSWLETISRAKEKLTKLGITTSLNPWETLLHADRGRKFRSGQNFQPMVDSHGRKAKAVACPLCGEWRRHMQKIWSCYASIEPNMIWIEDDFRYHNHLPLEWGGCFCDLHMKEFSEAIGTKVSRKEFFDAVIKPGQPHPYRKVWLRINRQTTNEVAKLIEKAVHKVSPATKVSLMTSVPSVHCSEGRDWDKLLANLAGDTSKVIRPHLPAYLEVSAGRYLWNYAGVSPYTQACVPDDTILYPELDNMAASNNRFSKSHKFARFQMLLALSMGIKGITLNIFQMNGNGPVLGENQQKMYSKSKPFLDRVAGLNINLKNQKGIKVLVSSRASENIRTIGGSNMEELYPAEVFWSQLLSCYGISNVIREGYEPNGEVVAVSGQYFRNISKKNVRELFDRNCVIMDGEAVETLFELGLGSLAGVQSVKWVKQDSGKVSYEQISDGGKYCGIFQARLSAQEMAGDVLLIKYCKPVDVRSVLKSPDGKTVGNGMTVYGNRVVILPYGCFPSFAASHLNPIRQELLQSILLDIAAEKNELTFAVGYPYLPVYRYELSNKVILLILNSSLDKARGIHLYLGNGKFKSARVVGSKTGREKIFNLRCKNGLYQAGQLDSLEAKLIILNKGK